MRRGCGESDDLRAGESGRREEDEEGVEEEEEVPGQAGTEAYEVRGGLNLPTENRRGRLTNEITAQKYGTRLAMPFWATNVPARPPSLSNCSRSPDLALPIVLLNSVANTNASKDPTTPTLKASHRRPTAAPGQPDSCFRCMSGKISCCCSALPMTIVKYRNFQTGRHPCAFFGSLSLPDRSPACARTRARKEAPMQKLVCRRLSGQAACRVRAWLRERRYKPRRA
jgi:hypothetical protein